VDLKDLKIERQPTSKRRRKNPWPVRIGLLGLLAGVAWAFWPMVSSVLDQIRLPLVRTFRVQEAAASTAASVRGTAANGYLVAARRAALSSDVPGRIVELNVTEGSVVKKGDIVARLFSDEYRAGWQQSVAALGSAETAVKRARANVKVALANISEARSSLANASALRDEGQSQLDYTVQERDRIVRLAATGIEGVNAQQQAERDYAGAKARLNSLVASVEVSAARVEISVQRANVANLEVEEAKDREKAARAARDQAKATLDKTDVRAPFDGIVVLKDAEVGEVVSPNVQGGGNARGAVCTMVDFGSLEVQANVPETTLSSVTVGAPADVFLDAFPDIAYPGTVDRIWPTADRQKATVEVRVKLNHKDDRLRPEMGVRIVFRKLDEQPTATDSTNNSRQIIIPLEAVVQIAGKSGTFLIERDTVRFMEVTTGKKKGGKVAIDAGLSPNQLIVLDPPATLQSGDRIRIQTN
jgi:RND family efflux transporter MFP subunit